MFTVTRGEGCRFFDESGKAFIDFAGGAGVASLGYGRSDVTDAVAAQAREGLYVPGSVEWPKWTELARALADALPGRLSRASPATGGSEAVEIALKAFRAAGRGTSVVSVENVYHGHTFGAAAVGNAWTDALGPPPSGFVKIPNAPDGDWDGVLDHLERVARERDDLAGFFTVPVQNEWPLQVPSRSFWDGVRDVCARHELLLGLDEVFTGFGRCGTMFASEAFDLEPDIVCLAKGMSGGYAAMGATVVTDEVFERAEFPSAASFQWLPAGVVAALEVFRVMREERLPENAADQGARLLGRLREMEGLGLANPRGMGLALAVDVVDEAGAPDAEGAKRVRRVCLDNGLIVPVKGPATLALSPPLVLDEATLDEGAGIMEDALRERKRVTAAP